ncbi:transposase [Streptomyces xanthophaeus]|uniref:transposase n=1 Tax=Streptomyces xanthophaeus TaxID=67385 RepID=UPI00233EEACF|nr:transposase [Streptomyces xanthophaeus]
MRRIGALTVRVTDAEISIHTAADTRTGHHRLLTTLTDPATHPAAELVRLYHERWEIESTYAELKSTILGGRVLRAQSPGPDLFRSRRGRRAAGVSRTWRASDLDRAWRADQSERRFADPGWPSYRAAARLGDPDLVHALAARARALRSGCGTARWYCPQSALGHRA